MYFGMATPERMASTTMMTMSSTSVNARDLRATASMSVSPVGAGVPFRHGTVPGCIGTERARLDIDRDDGANHPTSLAMSHIGRKIASAIRSTTPAMATIKTGSITVERFL